MSSKTLKDTADAILSNSTEIEVFGLGYVGFPLAARLAGAGMTVTGIDVNLDRVSRLKEGALMDTERNLAEVFAVARKSGRLRLATKPTRSQHPKVSFVCVPTPIPGGQEPSDVHVSTAVSRFLGTVNKGDVLIIESSIGAGTTDKIGGMINEAEYQPGKDIGLAFCPERIDPQNTRWTLENTPRIIYCSDDNTYHIASSIYSKINGSNLLRVSSAKVAEVTKSFENAFRLVNVSLVNELAVLCDSLGISAREVISAAASKPFGFMPFYPGAGAGGHCIPKDPVFLSESSRKMGGSFETIENALRINTQMPLYVASSIDALLEEMNLPKSVLVYGMAYKPDTEDMRDSPGFKITGELIKMRYDVGVYDPFLKPELLPKYLKENDMSEKQFGIVDDLGTAGYSCLCVVQHHSKVTSLLQNAYAKEVYQVIYDCQDRLRRRPDTTTVLKCLGSGS